MVDAEAEVARAQARARAGTGRPPIRTLGFDAPQARLIAAGFQPVRLVAPRLDATPRADAIMGAAEMGPRGRRLLEALVAPADRSVPVLITQADNDQAQIFAALRELRRLGEPVPEHVHFCDLLHIDRDSSRAYTAARLEQLDDWLVALGGARPDPAALAAAEAGLAAQRDMLRAVDAARLAGSVSGSAFLEAVAACSVLAPAEAQALLVGLPRRAEGADGLRVLVCGTAQEGPEVARAIEALGARIVGEVHPWGLPHVAGDLVPPRVQSALRVAERIGRAARERGAELVLHLSLDRDEAAPWDAGAVARAVPGGVRFVALRGPSVPDARFLAEIGAALRGEAVAPATVSAPGRPPAPRAAPARSRKVLASAADANAYNRAWFAEVREAVAAGAPFALVNANAPQEILRALDIPFVVNQWWASIVAAKQQSPRYQALLREHGYPGDVEAYSAQGLAAIFDEDAANAPWGGLPRPDFVHAVATSDPTPKLFEQWGAEAGAAAYLYERTIDPREDLFSDWWAQLPGRWDEVLEPERIDLMLAEMREVIAQLEAATGRRFDAGRFAEVMALVNEQEDYYRRTRDLVARTVPAPIGLVDSMPATMVPQWHRGTVWARDAARAFHDEVAARVAAGLAACPNERVRLMWVGRGLWSEMGFYQKWEDSHGAVFVWSMYLALAADGYIRDLSGGRDPLRALASRVICMGDELRMPTWAGPWHVHEAGTHQVDGVVALADADPFVVRALRSAGYPVLELPADNFNRESEDAAAIEAAITAFIEGPCSVRARARAEGARHGDA